jgi:hypothetical protein
MSNSTTDPTIDTTNAPFAFPPPSPMPQRYPISAQLGGYPPMPAPNREAIRSMADFARYLGESEFESPFSRETFCSAHRAAAMRSRREVYAAPALISRPAPPTWILDEQLVPHQVPASEAIGWFTAQFMQGEDSLIQLAHTRFDDDEASVETVFTGQPERMWEVTTYVDRTVTVHPANTLKEARQLHTGSVARIIAHHGCEPTSERKKLAAVGA